MGIRTAGEFLIERFVPDGGIRLHRRVPGFGLHEVAQQDPDAVAHRVVRVKPDELLIVIDGIFRQHVFIGLARGARRKIVRRVSHFHLRRGSGGRDRGVAEEIEIAGQRRAFPGGLLPVGRTADVETDALEQLLDREIFLVRQPQERRGKRTMGAGAIQCFGARCGRIGDDRALRRVDDGEAASRVVERGERIVSTGIEDDDAHPARNRLQRRHHVDQPERAVDQVRLGRNLGVDRHQIIFARQLHAVAGIIHHRHRIRAAAGDLAGKLLHRLDHLIVAEVRCGNHLEAGGIEQLRDRLGIVAGIGELDGVLIFRIADHQRDALFRTGQREGGACRALGMCGSGHQ